MDNWHGASLEPGDSIKVVQVNLSPLGHKFWTLIGLLLLN